MTKQVEPADRVGTSVLLPLYSQNRNQSILVPVKIISFKNVFGRDVYTVEPIGGRGTINVNADRIVLE